MMKLVAELDSAQLLAQMRALVERGNAVEADLLAYLGEVDARRLYLEEGCSSTVWEHDAGRCTYPSADGRRCDSREFVEFDHVDAWTRTRSHSVDGITLRCRAHNQQRARIDFGEHYIPGERIAYLGVSPRLVLNRMRSRRSLLDFLARTILPR